MADGCKRPSEHSEHSDHSDSSKAKAKVSFLIGCISDRDVAKSHTLCPETAHMQDMQVFLQAVGRDGSRFEDMIGRKRRTWEAKMDYVDFVMHGSRPCSFFLSDEPKSFRSVKVSL
mmetsp:Transcript_5112/g.8580  ORF Transcript_5112/g.8580 Transcript_5112/m.8580 type:complete len:116 (+) Transcript_5112:62-409(+)